MWAKRRGRGGEGETRRGWSTKNISLSTSDAWNLGLAELRKSEVTKEHQKDKHSEIVYHGS